VPHPFPHSTQRRVLERLGAIERKIDRLFALELHANLAVLEQLEEIEKAAGEGQVDAAWVAKRLGPITARLKAIAPAVPPVDPPAVS